MIITYLQVTVRHSYGREVVGMVASR